MNEITPTNCMIPNCSSKNFAKGSSPTLSSFPIPPNGSLRDIWISKIVNHLPPNYVMETEALDLQLCSLHFCPEDLNYIVTADLNLNQCLRPGAVPTLFPVPTNGNEVPSIPSSPTSTLQQNSSEEGVQTGTVQELELLTPDPLPVDLSTTVARIQDGGHSKFPCSYCPYLSSSLQNLRRHDQHHTVQSAFQCPWCTFSANFLTSLNQHLKRVHEIISSKSMEKKPAPSERPYGCPHCQHTFRTNPSLQRHLVLHSTPASFQCPHCIYSSSLFSRLSKHIKNNHPEFYLKSSMIETSPTEIITSGEQSRKKKKLDGQNGSTLPNHAQTDDSRNFWDASDALLDEALVRKLRVEGELRDLQRELRELWVWINAYSGNEPPGKRPEIFLTGMAQRFQQAEAALVFIQLEEGALRREREKYFLLSQPAFQV